MALLKIDEQEITVDNGTTVLNAAKSAGIEIPHYCYHPAMSIVGSCRMCMVEVVGMPKLQTSCSTHVGAVPDERKVDGKYDMVVNTKTAKVDAARKLILEFLLLNHPLDCPVCDQAGECDLQDYSFKYGSAHSRFIEDKRVRANEDLGSGVVINQDRCILCTLCVRFTREISGTDELFIMNRGYKNKVSIFEGEPLDNPLAGNVADICPVGALLLKDYIHTTRVWHLSKTPSTCTECSAGCSITVDAYRNRVHRIVSRENEQANGYFICDYGRYAHHSYEESRITVPLIKNGPKWDVAHWGDAYNLTKSKIDQFGGNAMIRGLASPTLSNESNYLFGQLMNSLADRKNVAMLPVTQTDDQVFKAGFRISGDKGGNSHGVKDMISNLAASVKTIYSENIGVLLILDADRRGKITADVEKLMGAASYVIVLSAYESEITAKADLILPIAGVFEREGTVTNDKGLVQWLQPALEPGDDAKPGWQVVAELARLITGEGAMYNYAGDVTWKIAQSVTAYGQVTRFKLGQHGMFVESSD